MRVLPTLHLTVLLTVLLTLLLGPGLSSPAGAVPEPDEADEPAGVWPLQPEPAVVAGFAPPPHPYAVGHRGADLAGAPGQAVHAALPGTVGFAGSIGGKPVVTVVHGGRRTTYEPVAATVEVGDEVAGGDVIGRLVLTDSHCFPAACLHWGLIEGRGSDQEYLDPLTLVGGGPVRLLPLWRDEPVTPRLPWSPAWAPPLARWPRPVDTWVRTGVDAPVVMPAGGPAGTPGAAGRWSRGCRAG
ncbi:murein DD-endopeptidase MepM/ murein hydrolase activator NlpD [Nocardioides cavernae]|uniref:Murein DD-endopeptidase MepM/ murein hydrolase activator NlpD n=1 Tax=Nocardioides cavernae TaxID=1921566 RepID=A0A7Y9GYX4_9ACTN|nr:peptidoglycan DD-metalloendopeptidase family protein [Nocardioides cavernae]NYE34911.1 murein DD-endopeptidase MepM/ murein hydrolase activator NlpD [Nocardioides cavernae]